MKKISVTVMLVAIMVTTLMAGTVWAQCPAPVSYSLNNINCDDINSDELNALLNQCSPINGDQKVEQPVNPIQGCPTGPTNLDLAKCLENLEISNSADNSCIAPVFNCF